MARPKQFDPTQALLAAMDQFRRSGYDSTSLADITARTGVRKASLYATYGDKRALFLQALDCYSERALADLRESLAHTTDVRATLRDFTMSFVGAVGSEPERSCLCVNSAVEFGSRDPVIAERLAAHSALVEKDLADAIVLGQQRGEFRADVDPAVTARLLQVVLYGVIVSGKASYTREQLAEALDLALGAIATGSAANGSASAKRTPASARTNHAAPSANSAASVRATSPDARPIDATGPATKPKRAPATDGASTNGVVERAASPTNPAPTKSPRPRKS